MQNIDFENRAIAFIDVLGFKSVVDAAAQCDNKLKELEELIGVLESAVPSLDGTVDRRVPRDLIPKHIYIADSIILSAPLSSDKMPSYRGLSILVMRVIQLSHILLSKGYLLRGGISVGPVWHTDSNTVGTAYQEAYQIETKTLVPRVELSRNAQELWCSTEGPGNAMCRDYKSHLVFKHLLREAGIDIDSDQVEIGQLPETTQTGISFGVAAARALAEGRVDGIWANVLGCEVAVHLGAGSVVVDTRVGDGPPGAGNYSFIALATTESNIETESERIEAVIRAVVRAQSMLRRDPLRATELAAKLFPALEAGQMNKIVARDAEFYQASIPREAIEEMNRFATAVGLLSYPVPYEQVVATQFRNLWSE